MLWSRFVGIALLASVSSLGPPARAAAPQEERVILRLERPATIRGLDVGLAEVDAIARDYGVTEVRPAFRTDMTRNAAAKRRYGFDRTYLYFFPAGIDVDAIVERFGGAAGVVHAEPDVVGQGAQVPPNDTSYSVQWDRENTGQSGGTPDADIDAEDGWALTTGSSSVVIAVLDTGVDSAHPEFAGRIVAGFDFVNDDADPEADHSHGTSVGGIALANANNAFALAGVDWAALHMPVKVLDQNNSGFTTDLVDGIMWATDNGADVINMSLINYPCSGSLKSALQYAIDGGAINISSAGNNGIGDADLSGPGCLPESISVGATDDDDVRASFSATGSALDITAPGEGVRTIRYRNYSDGWTNFSGTSAAAPIVAGIAGLMRALDPTITHDQVGDILESTAEDEVGPASEDTPGRDDFFGWGRVNMAEALSAVNPDPLRQGRVQPQQLGVFGTASFSVIYTNGAGTAPDFVQLVLDGPQSGVFAMSAATSGHPSLIDGDFSNGERYEVDVVLNFTGTYSFHFESATGGVPERFPASGQVSGPVVDLVIAEDVATAETSVESTIFDLDYTATHTLNNSSELIDEVVTSGAPPQRFSTLDHRFTFQVTGGDVVTFYVSANLVSFWPLENDNYDVSYSIDGGSVWNPMLTIDESNPTETYKSFTMPPGTSGEVLVRFEDTDSTGGNDGVDRLAIDHMFFRSEQAATPGEANDLMVTGYDSQSGVMSLSWSPACGASDHNVVYGPLQDVATYGYTGQDCAVGNSGSYGQFDPGAGSWFFVIVGTDGASVEGSYGVDAADDERPELTTDPVCPYGQNLQFRCD